MTLQTVKQRAVRGVLALTGRTFFLQAVSFVSIFLLTIFLEPAQFGIFFLVSAVINFFTYFSDVGLAAALIQKKGEVTQEELRTTFTIQQSLVLVLLLLVFFLTPVFQGWYSFSQESVLLLWALGFSFFLSSLKTVPSVLLERRLDFNRLVIPQIVETLLFNIVVVYLAWRGFGITSFTIAVLVRGFSGLIMIYILQPWMPGFAFARNPLRRLLRFGLPYQANTFLAVVKDDGITMALGGILGPAGIGLLGWAQKWAFAPLRFFMDQVIKVTFPAFSRMQDDPEELSRAVSKSILFVSFFVFPSLVGLILVAPLLIEVIPKYEKWQPAILALSLYGISSAWAAVTTPLTNLLNAIGRITTTLRLMIMWTTLTWIFVPVLAMIYGINGAAAGAAIVGTSSAIAIFIVRRYVRFDLIGSVAKPILATLLMGLVVLLLRSVLASSGVSVILLIISGVAAYVAATFFLVGPSIVADFRKIFNAIRR